MYAPFASVSAVRVPNWEVAMITAPGMPRPVGSLTLPEIVPVVSSWARAGVTVARTSSSSAAHEKAVLVIFSLRLRHSTPTRGARSDSPGHRQAWGITQSQYRVRAGERKADARILGAGLRCRDRQGRAEIARQRRVDALETVALA